MTNGRMLADACSTDCRIVDDVICTTLPQILERSLFPFITIVLILVLYHLIILCRILDACHVCPRRLMKIR